MRAFLGIFVGLSLLTATPAVANDQPFGVWVAEFKEDALREGISRRILDEAFSGVQSVERIIELDRKQPESTMTQAEYLKKVVTQERINKARRLKAEHSALLNEVSASYGVPPEYIVALWAIESNFGERMGGFEVVEALATLAHDGRRSAFFRKELMNAFTILNEGHISVHDMLGSWAGAMGQCQFMPSSFLRYAVDYNQDGRKDIWQSQPDVFASIANYLSSEGWDASRSYGNADSKDANFQVILRWNRSNYFATAVGKLAAAIR